jgi:hypothetical protein
MFTELPTQKLSKALGFADAGSISNRHLNTKSYLKK